MEFIMNLPYRESEGVLIIDINQDVLNEIDYYEINQLDEIINEQFKDFLDISKNFVINLSDTEYIKSNGLSMFLIMKRFLKDNHAKFALCNINDRILDVLDLSGLSDFFNIFDFEQEALAYLRYEVI